MLSDHRISEHLVPPYASVTVVPSTGSTNADQAVAAERGAPDRSVLIAGEQTAGRGRRDRSWASPSGGGLYCSVLYRPAEVAPSRLGTLTVVAGVALVRACRSLGVETSLKWPNDLLYGEAKLCGVLAEAGHGAAVLGMGLNLTPPPETVPLGAGALGYTSLAGAGARAVEHEQVAVALLTELDTLERRWRAAGGDLAAAGLLDEYRACCVTIGKRVRVEFTDGSIEGTATDVDPDGQLILDGRRSISAGDVVHLRAQ